MTFIIIHKDIYTLKNNMKKYMQYMHLILEINSRCNGIFVNNHSKGLKNSLVGHCIFSPETTYQE